MSDVLLNYRGRQIREPEVIGDDQHDVGPRSAIFEQRHFLSRCDEAAAEKQKNANEGFHGGQ